MRGTRRAIVTIAAMAMLVSSCAATVRRPRIAVAYRFQCTPADARVIVDEVDQGACRVWEVQYLGLPAGTHRVRIERDGYFPDEREMPSNGRRETVQVRLRAVPE